MSNRGPSAYQPKALPLGQTGSRSNLSDSHFTTDGDPVLDWCLVFQLRSGPYSLCALGKSYNDARSLVSSLILQDYFPDNQYSFATNKQLT